MAVATAIFRSRERSEHYELRLSLDHASALAQGTPITEFPFHIHNPLAKKGEIKMKSMNFFGEDNKSLLSSPTQDEEGNLTFELEGRTCSLNVNLEEERERVKT